MADFQVRMLSWGQFPGGPVVKTVCFHCRGHGSISSWETKISQTAQHH